MYLKVMGAVVMALVFTLGVGLVVSGFRFINPTDTMARFFFGGAMAAGSLAWSIKHRHDLSA
jgi:hypothetical protein